VTIDFTGELERALVCAQDEALRLGSQAIGTQHQLLGLLHGDDADVLRIFEEQGVTLARARERTAALPGPGDASGFTPAAGAALDLAVQEALDCGHREVGPGHLVLGILRAEDAPTETILSDLGADTVRIARSVYAYCFRFPGALETLG
jgi:ATP-dependent Clp protease ATP-binding subunit ClpC